MKPSDILISVVIPVYRSADIVNALCERLTSVLDQMGNYQIILVNDGSPDDSWPAITEVVEQYKDKVVGVNLLRNFGQSSAIMAGLQYVTGRYVVIMDDDLQHEPADIPKLLEKSQSGFDIVFAEFEPDQQSLWKRVGSKFNEKTAELLFKKPKGLYLSPYKIFSATLVPKLLEYTGPYPYIDGLLLRTTRNIATIQTKHLARHSGTGNFNLQRSIALWLRVATTFSVMPLRFVGLFGFASAVLAFMGTIVYLATFFLGMKGPEGWITLIIVVLFFGGVQMMALGVIGEYMGRMYLTINQAPQFFVREVVGDHAKNGES